MRIVFTCMIFILHSLIAQAKVGNIEGRVVDESNTPLIGAIIKVEGTALGSKTDMDGKFIIRNIEYGTYSIIVSYISYDKKIITDIKVSDVQQAFINISMNKSTKGIGEVLIKGSLKKETLNALLVKQKNLSTISDGISAESIRRSPDKNTGDVLKRINGVSISEGKFAVIRGLSDRYNLALLNGSILPSSEADRKSFSFEIFPSAMLDNITIIKAATPDMPGDFAGGIIDLTTKDIPSENFFNLQLASGMNTKGTFSSYYDSKNGTKDWIGLDDGGRSLPKSFPPVDSFFSSTFTKQQKIEASKLIKNDWALYKKDKMPPYNVFQLSTGYVHTFKNKSVLGIVGALSYNRSRRLELIERKEYNLDNSFIFDYLDTINRENVLAGALLNISMKLNDKNKISFRNSYNINSDDQTILRNGQNENGQLVKSSSSQFTSNQLLVSQLSGDHMITKHNIKVQWSGVYDGIQRTVPDLRKTYYILNYPMDSTYKAYVPYGKASPNYSGKFYSTFNEKIYNGKLDITIPFKYKSVTHSLKVGSFMQSKNRVFDARVLGYVVANPAKYNSALENLSEDMIFDISNIHEQGFRIDDITLPTDHYEATSNLKATYIMLDHKLLSKFRLIYGLRYESFNQELRTKVDKSDKLIKNHFNSLLPSLNLIYSLNKTTNIRLCASRTLARPEFREMAPFSFYDFNTSSVIIGYDSLVQSTIQNFDLRYEVYPGKGQVLSASFFYKHFNNPIEQVFFSTGAGSRLRTFQNANYANNYGLELEFRRSLSMINSDEKSMWSNSTVFGNFAMIKSLVKLNNVDESVISKRPLQGQSPYLINAGFTLNHPKYKLNTTLLYNRIGKRLFLVGDYSTPDVYENSRDIIDFQISKTILNRVELRLTFSDILHQPFIFYQNIGKDTNYAASTDNVTQKNSVGSGIGLSLNCKL